MNKEKKISVLISTFNKSDFIKKTIESCLNQNYNNYEIIIVDTGSTDRTINILKKFRLKRKIKIKFLQKKYLTGPLNQIYAIKSAFHISNGDIVCLLDGDDIFNKNKLKEVNFFFNKHPRISFAQDIPIVIKNNIRLKYKLNRPFPLFKIWPKFYPTSTFSIKRSELNKFFRETSSKRFNLLEIDARLFFYSKLFKAEHRVLNKNLTYYIKNENGISSKFKRFSNEWLLKRTQAHYFLINLLKFKKYPYKIDFFISKFFYNLVKKF